MILEVKDGCFGYFGQPVIFDHINLSLEKGHILAVLGPNGIGKTTLLKCMIGLLPWKRGQTLLNGQNIVKMKPADIWKTISYIPQSHGFAFSYTGLEMVLLGRSAHLGMFQQPGKEDLFNPDFAEAYKKDDDARRIIDTALSIEGLTRGEGVHACAVLICRDPVNEHVPTKLDTKGGVEITQYEGHTVADMGLLKMDFLGLRTLTVISKAKANIKKNFGIDIKEEEIPFDDPEIFKLMGSGHTAGVFQVESAGMTATIKNMKPTEYKHVVALIALYRPGPLGAGMVSSYINRMNGKEPAVSYDDRLDDILGETYGTMVYQEQVMLISGEMCGFSKG